LLMLETRDHLRITMCAMRSSTIRVH
jgi:hypothetical protein